MLVPLSLSLSLSDPRSRESEAKRQKVQTIASPFNRLNARSSHASNHPNECRYHLVSFPSSEVREREREREKRGEMEKSAVGWRFHNLSGIHFVLCRSQRDQREERLKFFEKKWCACVCLYDRYMIARSAEIACASMGRQKGTNPSGLYLSQRGKFKRRGFATFADTTPDKFDTESRENAFSKYWNASNINTPFFSNCSSPQSNYFYVHRLFL